MILYFIYSFCCSGFGNCRWFLKECNCLYLHKWQVRVLPLVKNHFSHDNILVSEWIILTSIYWHGAWA